MPALSDYTSGTITLTNGLNTFTGTGTGWEAADFREGDTILGIEDHAGVEYVIATIDGNGSGTLTQDWEGATGVYTYRMRYLADGARVTAQARNLIELLGNGNLQALAGLTGPGVPVFNGPHSMTVKPETDFINGVAYDVQVDTLADRAAYDGQSAGFSVLVSDIGDGRSAVYSKNTNAVGDWSDPAYVTGPVGPLPDVEATVTMLPPGSPATVVETPIPGGVQLDFSLPEASGFYNAGVYDIGEAYDQDDVVRHNGSSFIALQAVPAGESPSNAVPPVDTAYWQVLAVKGQDGAGTGDVVGPSGVVSDRIAVFDGTTGKLIKDGGSTIAEIVPGPNSVTNTILADMAVNTIKGRVTAGTGDPQDLTAAQAMAILKSAGAYAKDNVLGTVSQASGVPTGAIIERGSNANGSYVRFADGTMICHRDFSWSTIINSASGALFFGSASGQIPSPSTFATTPQVSIFATSSINIILTCQTANPPTTANLGSYFPFNPASAGASSVDITVRIIAIGRWF